MENLFLGFICAFLLVKYAVASDPNYCGSEEYANRSLIFKYCYFYLSIFITRCRYYVGWKLCQGSIDLCGLGYTEKTNPETQQVESSFDKIDACNLYVMEFSISPRTKIQYWNRSVHIWLKYHLFLRLINTKYFSKNKGLASMITFSVSAVWHGFYPSYYLFFAQYFFIEQITAYLENRFDLFNVIDKSNFFIKFIAWKCVMATLCYFGQTFPILYPQFIYNYYKAFNFIPNIMLVLIFAVTCILSKKRSKVVEKSD